MAETTPAVPAGYKPAVHVPPELEALASAHYSMHGNGLVHNLIAAVLPAHEAMVRERVAAENWVVPKVPHDETVSVGPRILRSGLIRREAGTSDADHTRQYAAQLLAAAGETTTTKEN